MRSPHSRRGHFQSASMIRREGFYTLMESSASGRGGKTSAQGGGVLQIRVAEVRDAEAIASVINAAFRQAESFLIDRDRVDLGTVLELLRTGIFLVADKAPDNAPDNVADDLGVLCGCVYVEMRGERSYLGLLSVDPLRQKSGLGSKLMNAAEDYCAKAGSRSMDLQIVNLRQENHAFYRRRGYIETGTAPFPPGLNPKLPYHFVKMSKPLT
jgi:GNAT superfamily N-acetyltransferase